MGLALILVTGCSDPTGPVKRILGLYELVSVDGSPLPYFTVELDLRANETFIETLHHDSFGTDTLWAGTYTYSKKEIALRVEGAVTRFAAVHGDSLTIDDDGIVSVYERRSH